MQITDYIGAIGAALVLVRLLSYVQPAAPVCWLRWTLPWGMLLLSLAMAALSQDDSSSLRDVRCFVLKLVLALTSQQISQQLGGAFTSNTAYSQLMGQFMTSPGMAKQAAVVHCRTAMKPLPLVPMDWLSVCCYSCVMSPGAAAGDLASVTLLRCTFTAPLFAFFCGCSHFVSVCPSSQWR